MTIYFNYTFRAILVLLLVSKLSIPSISQTVNVLDFGADPTGEYDNSSVINALVDSLAKSGGGTMFIPAGKYLLNDAIFLQSNINLKGQDLEKSIFFRDPGKGNWASTKAQALVTTLHSSINENVTVENLSVDAGFKKNELNGKGGVCLRNTHNSRISNVNTYNTWHGVAFYGYRGENANNVIDKVISTNAHASTTDDNSGRPRGVLITDFGSQAKNSISVNAGTGFYANGKDIKFLECHAENWFNDNGFYLIVDNLYVSKCTAKGGETPAKGFGSGFAIAYKKGGVIENSKAINCSNYGFRIHVPQSDTKLINNTAIGCGIGYGIETASHPFPEVSNHIELVNNTAENSGLHGFLFRQMSNSSITGNKAINGNQRGLTLSTRGAIALKDYLSGNTFSKNECFDNQQKKTQIYGFYDFSKNHIKSEAKKGKNNKIKHSSFSGIDMF
ncbi:Right handed beta helix region [Algoriphagus locisalis]|uniref:Right handed beta helix region n=1 Tax=Algoriphagus locisalis TaxID=305507 RepID=A0A1I6XQM3_9BACT|nr:right-handed parallel beta-helix repeat-containing protein [Algoriphagus locisalis]SFT40034.1 Right handed beta helix region [Algoriphagus locisalis]